MCVCTSASVRMLIYTYGVWMQGMRTNSRYYANFYTGLCELCTDIRVQPKKIWHTIATLLTMRWWSQLFRWRYQSFQSCMRFCSFIVKHIACIRMRWFQNEFLIRNKARYAFSCIHSHRANSVNLHCHCSLHFIVEENNQVNMWKVFHSHNNKIEWISSSKNYAVISHSNLNAYKNVKYLFHSIFKCWYLKKKFYHIEWSLATIIIIILW